MPSLFFLSFAGGVDGVDGEFVGLKHGQNVSSASGIDKLASNNHVVIGFVFKSIFYLVVFGISRVEFPNSDITIFGAGHYL